MIFPFFHLFFFKKKSEVTGGEKSREKKEQFTRAHKTYPLSSHLLQKNRSPVSITRNVHYNNTYIR